MAGFQPIDSGREGLAARVDGLSGKALLGQIAVVLAGQLDLFFRLHDFIKQPAILPPLLETIAVPTLVVVGDEDTLTPPAASETMASALPSATLVVIPQAGHLSNLEQPQAFNAAVLSFLERCQ